MVCKTWVNLRLGRLPGGSSICYPLPLANFSIAVLFYQFMIMLIWCGVTRTMWLQVLQNKFAKINLNRLLYKYLFVSYLSPSNLKVAQPRNNDRFYHGCIYVYNCINGLTDHTMEPPANRDAHYYPGRLSYKSEGDARRLALGCPELQILVSLRVFGMESHYICPFRYCL